MNKKRLISFITALMLLLPSTSMTVNASGKQTRAANVTTVALNPADASPSNDGRFEGWGTSLCWWANRIGYSDKLTQAAAKAFFSEEGLGLDIARYNLGGGDDPSHSDKNADSSKPYYLHVTRSDSMVPGVWKTFELSNDGKTATVTEYDLQKDKNQLNVAKAALEANPDLYFEGFSNSPPYFMTNSGCTSGAEDANTDNLKTDMYDDFGKFIAEATLLFKNEGIEFKSYSPMNEPDTNYWGANSPKQEGCHYSPGTSQSNAIIETRKALDAAGLTDVIVAGMDETDINKSVSNYPNLTAEAKTALGRIDTHTYNGTKRAELKNVAKNAGKTLWMSEVDGGWAGQGLAGRIIEDMNGMQPAAWVMWDIIDVHKDSKIFQYPPESGKFPEKDKSVSYTGLLWGVGMADHDKEELVFTNKYYVFGQFSKFINPGDTIIASSNNTLAAYNKDTGDIKIVANNSENSSDAPYKFDLSGFSAVGNEVSVVRSDMAGNEKWKTIDNGAALTGKTLTTTLKANTVTTFVIKSTASVTEFTPSADGLKYSYSVSDSAKNYDSYLAVYNPDKTLKAVVKNAPSGTMTGDFTDCTFKLMVWDDMSPQSSGAVFRTSAEGVGYAFIGGSSNDISRGSEKQLTVEANIKGEPVWSIDNTDLATISDKGVLKANKVGEVTVTANLGDYIASRTFDITVYANIQGKNEVSVGATAPMTVDTNAVGIPSWSVSDTSIATITEDGVLSALKAGTVTVTMRLPDITVTKTVKVTLYEIKGTRSWGNATTAPADSADYRKAVDGNLDTYFDGTQNGYVMYDYGTPFKINSVKLAARSGHDGRTVGAKIQGSNDAINWTDLYTITSKIAAGSYTDVKASSLQNNRAYRYFRYTNPAEMTNIAEFLIDASPSSDVAAGEPTVLDIDELTDDFESSENIFNADAGDLSADGAQVYKTNLERYSNVFMPVKAAARAELAEEKALTSNDRFRISFDMFSGWESSGKENEFQILDSDNNELVGFKISGGGYNLNQMRIGGKDLLADKEKPVAQCISTDKDKNSGNLKGANGWDGSSQKYANNMGLNKTVEIIIDGTGIVTVTMNGGAADLSYSGTVTAPINIKSLVLTGNHNAARGRTVSYDNFDADVITYSTPLATPAPPTPTPKPTDAPVLPANNELINLNFDNGNLDSSSSYGKASGSPKFVTVDGKKCAQFENSAATAITLTDANGNALLTGMEEITISFKIKPTSNGTSWWFFAAPNAQAQTANNEKYIGCLTNGGTLTFERYNNSGKRPTNPTGAYKLNEWNDVIITIADGVSRVYVNGIMSEQNSGVDISQMLGSDSVAYIGLAKWGSGEFSTGYIDDFVITKGVVDVPTVTMGDLSAVTENLALPEKTEEGYDVSWTSSDESVITDAGVVTRSDETKTAVLTASITKDTSVFTQSFTVTVLGCTAPADTFAAYAEDGSIKVTSDYSETVTPYSVKIELFNSSNERQGTIENQINGAFDDIQNGIYTVSCKLLSGDEVKKEVTRTVKVKTEAEMGAYLFAHFVGTEQNASDEQIYFSVSLDGTNWTTVNDKKPILTSTVGENGVRDPYILRGEDGKFFIIATDLSINGRSSDANRWSTCQTSGSKSIVIWESTDLVNWSEARLVKVAPDEAGCTWAPEAVYDAEKDAYMVFWASKVSTDNYSTQRMYRSYTKDFVTFTAPPELYIDGDTVSNIDTTIISNKGWYYRFTKNESKSTVTMMKSTSLSGEWEDVKTYTLADMTGYEGPTIYKLNGQNKWCLLLDYYSKSQGYKPFTTDDIRTGVFKAAADFNFDTKYRHGTVIPITKAEYDAIVAKY